ncbi:MAG TPA: Flp family type IVb pilin [Victivallales bacterium]|nr:Flp family type IVb pilin [Victivallales bacterium]HPO90745.1 Flp family type IVb pilin [Victivallales bacterium]HRR06128.1 Flp family type IVb pilin [Victivallales bacterium]HRR28396.1 Flp family type IVb pilin [Victivallales bacterium]HRU00153.1 Flp family type IVb pilin [Victivallales bacterium]
MKIKRKSIKSAATFIEYAMLAGLIAIVVAIAASFFGKQVKSLFTSVGEKTQGVSSQVQGSTLQGDFSQPQ